MLFLAYLDARKNKRKTQDQYRFEVNAVENLKNLRDEILARKYRPGRGVAFMVYDPVMREIFAAPFRDRVVHRFLYNMTYDWWDKRLIYDSYSCRIGKGVLRGAERLRKNENRAIGKYKESVYIIKMDIQGYFMSLPRKRLFERVMWGLDRQFPKQTRGYYVLRYLWQEVIFDDPTKGVRKRGKAEEWAKLPFFKSLFYQKPGKGIVIGNLSSQLLSNIYLDLLDRFVKFDLKYEFYGRYVDDFYILVPKSKLKQAMKDVEKIRSFLSEMELTLHPRKLYIQDINKGVKFLGFRVFPNRILPGPRITRRYARAVREIVAGERDLAALASYMGYLSHLKAEKIQGKIFEGVGWDWEKTGKSTG